MSDRLDSLAARIYERANLLTPFDVDDWFAEQATVAAHLAAHQAHASKPDATDDELVTLALDSFGETLADVMRRDHDSFVAGLMGGDLANDDA